jgi:anaerobic magnesium-protoporphyrin IX monomethyl ester cyclase
MFSLGLASLSAVLKEKGHQTDLLAVDRVLPSMIASKLASFAPELIGVTSTTDQFPLAGKLIAFISGTVPVSIVLGGIHPTVCPEESIALPGVRAVCIGEGEGAILDIIQRLGEGRNLDPIPNLWVRRPDGSVLRNEVRPLIEDLDTLPFPDRDLFPYRSILRNRGCGLEVMASRGCPFPCSFCSSHKLQELYRGKGKFVRYRSVKNVIEEIRTQMHRFPEATTVTFHDDTFNLNKDYLRELGTTYAKEVRLPFRCNLRADLLDEETMALLKEANCGSVWIGVEAGNDQVRNQVLQKKLSRDHLVRAFELARGAGIKTRAFNMIGSPGETREQILETIRLNQRLAPDEIPTPAIFRPYPGTLLYDYCAQKGWISQRTTQGYGDSSILNQPSISARQLNYLQEVFPYLVRQTRMLPLFKALAHLRVRRAYAHLPEGMKALLRIPLNFLRGSRRGPA